MKASTPKSRRDRAMKLNTQLKQKSEGLLPASAGSTTSRFNFRGNRPRMGKRGMCGSCGCVVCMKVSEGDTCPQCGQPSMSDVSYDD